MAGDAGAAAYRERREGHVTPLRTFSSTRHRSHTHRNEVVDRHRDGGSRGSLVAHADDGVAYPEAVERGIGSRCSSTHFDVSEELVFWPDSPGASGDGECFNEGYF